MRLALSCPACDAQIGVGDRYCLQCGASLSTEPSPSTPTGQQPTPVGRGEGAERRLITVMFCDMVKSSELAARLDPEDFAALLVNYRQHVDASVRRYSGYIASYIGDGVLACFGYPRAIGRDARAAVTCALDITRDIAGLTQTANFPGADQLAVRIGIETGVVVAGTLGSGRARELDALVGLALPMAWRLQQVAPANGVVIGETTKDLVAQEFRFEPVAAERLDRLPTAAAAFRVLGPREHQGRWLPVPQVRAPIVDRSEECALLAAHWAKACSGCGQTLLVSGEPGIGKSRLIQELLDSIDIADSRIVALICTPQTAMTALHPVIEAFRAALTVRAGSAGITVATLEPIVDELRLPRATSVPLLAQALGAGEGLPEMAPAHRRRLLMQCLEAWLLHDTAASPMLLAAEDLHWADPSTIELLHTVTELVPTRRMMLVVTYRSHVALAWPPRPNLVQLVLQVLERADAERLLRLLRGDPSTVFAEAVLSRAEGVPLFIEELALAADHLKLPSTLQELFAARLDALGEAKKLAQAAAVFGREVTEDLLSAMAGLSQAGFVEQLAKLIAAEILLPASSPPSVAYAFRHAVLQEAAYESLLLSERRRMHARAASLLRQLRPAIVERQPQMVAEHYAVARRHVAAVRYFTAAVRRSLAVSALSEAESQARRGLTIAAELTGVRRDRARLELHMLLGHVLIASRGYASSAVREAFEEALGSAGSIREDDRILPLLRGLASFYQVRGPLSTAGAICQRLVHVANRTQDACMLTDAWRRQAWNEFCRGNIIEAEHLFHAALHTFDPARLDEHITIAGNDPHVLGLANLCWLDLIRHGTGRCVERAEECIGAAERSPHSMSACYGFVFAAAALQAADHWDRAAELAAAAHQIAGQKGIVYWIALSEVILGHDQVHRGQVRNGREAIVIGLERYIETQGELLRPYIMSLHAEAEAKLGARDMAENSLRQAIRVACDLEAFVFTPGLTLQLARLVGSRSRTDADCLARSSLDLAESQGALATSEGARHFLASLP